MKENKILRAKAQKVLKSFYKTSRTLFENLTKLKQVNEMEELIAQLVPSASDDEDDQGDDDRTKEE